jgi:hypothetical protein
MRLTLLCCSLLLALPTAASEVYRWVDNNGVVHFSDRPIGDDAERLSVRTARPTETVAVSAPADGNDEGKLFAEPDQAEIDEQRRANCQAASERLAQVLRSPRLFREAPDGSRRYLEDEEIAVLRAEAEELVAAWCD